MKRRILRWRSWIRPRRRAGSGEVIDVAGWATLSAVLDDAVALQPAADEAIRACGARDDPTGAVARRAGEVAGRYLALRHRLPVSTSDPRLAARVTSADRLLHAHQWLLAEAVHLRFSVARNARRAEFARRFTGLGRAGPGLVELRNQIRVQASDVDTTTPS
jgi:hypothetical protein